MKIVVYGQPAIKKNAEKVVNLHGRMIKITSKAYTQWHKDALVQLRPIAAQLFQPIDYPINIACKFFVKDKRRRDLSNCYEGIMDTLVEVGILQDDNYTIVCSHDGSGVALDRDNPRIEIEITPKITAAG